MPGTLEKFMVVLGLKTEGFPQAQAAVQGFTSKVNHSLADLKTAVAGYFTVEAASELSHAVSEMAQRWKDLSEQTGLSTDEVQKYDAAFKKVGLTAEDAAAAFEILTQKRKEALESGGDAEKLFRKFGLSEDELRSLDSGAKLFERLARGRSATNQGDRELFGEAFGTKRGGKFLAGAQSLAEGGGNVPLMSSEDIKTLDDAAKEFAAAINEFKVASAPLVAALTTGFGKMVDWFKDLLPSSFKPTANGGKAESKYTGIDDEIEYTATVEGENDLMEHRLATAKRLKRGSKNAYAPRHGTATNSESVLAGTSLTSAFDNDPLQAGNAASNGAFSVTQAAIDKKLSDAMFGVMFKAGNKRQQKQLADQQISKLQNDLANEPDELKKAGIQSDIYKAAGQRADLEKQNTYTPAADSLAAVGGMVGGAGAALDPSLTVQQNMLEVLKQILAKNSVEIPKTLEAITQ